MSSGNYFIQVNKSPDKSDEFDEIADSFIYPESV